MKARNVIISLLFVIALLAFTLIKVRYWEPKKKTTFKRNINRVDYTAFAMCLMDCQEIDANDISEVIRNGEIISYSLDMSKNNCPDYVLKWTDKHGKKLTIFITQCGNVSRVTNCNNANVPASCNCDDKKPKPL